MGNNRFHGTIPDMYKCAKLKGLILNGNQLEGEVPSSLRKCHSLEVLDIGNNQLNGTFPSWFADLPYLQVLILKSNNFHGHIITSWTTQIPFPCLLVLDLSHNGFVGQLPAKYIQNFNAMKKVIDRDTQPRYLYYSITVVIKGVQQHLTQIFIHYTIVNLSYNDFDAEIPIIIENLNSLIVLDLSHNKLTGPIPPGIGKISEIESLDLSCNQLTGEIPQSLADLTFLGFLNLSENKFVGHIPQGKQFNTFDGNAFGWNPKLCGLPLPKKCGEHPQQLQLETDADEAENGFTWNVVMWGYGCGTLFGIFMGCIMISTGKPKWFNIADASAHMILNSRNKRRHIYIGK